MRLTELTGYKNNPNYRELLKSPSFAKFAKLAIRQGWKLYGHGFNGAVLKHPNRDWVYKVFSDQGDPASGYYGYVVWAAHNQNNPFVPRVGKTVKIPGTAHQPHPAGSKDLYVVRIELLSPANGKNDPRFEKYIDPRYNRDETDHGDLDQDEELTLYDHAMSSLFHYDKNFRQVWEFASDQLDLDIDNVMFRGNQLVLTDPMA
jgi:hypothetical protein